MPNANLKYMVWLLTSLKAHVNALFPLVFMKVFHSVMPVSLLPSLEENIYPLFGVVTPSHS